MSSILIYSSDGVCGNVCVGLIFFSLPEFHLYPQPAQKLHRSGRNQNFNRKEQSREEQNLPGHSQNMARNVQKCILLILRGVFVFFTPLLSLMSAI